MSIIHLQISRWTWTLCVLVCFAHGPRRAQDINDPLIVNRNYYFNAATFLIHLCVFMVICCSLASPSNVYFMLPESSTKSVFDKSIEACDISTSSKTRKSVTGWIKQKESREKRLRLHSFFFFAYIPNKESWKPARDQSYSPKGLTARCPHSTFKASNSPPDQMQPGSWKKHWPLRLGTILLVVLFLSLEGMF